MSTPRLCSECGSPISESSRDGFCPRCLIGLALNAEEKTRIVPPPENEFPDPVGSVFGNYELLDVIGRGGMGVVYKARQRTLDRVVALKLTLTGALATEAEIKRFRTEATSVAALQHPNIVAIHDVGEHEGRHYFSMDYIEGQSLADVIRRTPLPAERAARYVKTIAHAIHYAHGRGILHRDLKPHNVLIDGKDEPLITDFGLARQIEVDSELTASGLALGTPSYMPPEQAEGKRKEIGPASDVYSLGAILYDSLTGRPPFHADTPLDTLRQVIDTEPAAPRLLNRKVPRDLETVCLKCLAKAPGQRYTSAQDLADDLGRFLRHEPIQARPVGRLGRLWRWGRRNPAVAVLSSATAMLLLLLAAAAVLLRDDIKHGVVVDVADKVGRVEGELLRLKLAFHDVASRPALAPLIVTSNISTLDAYFENPLGSLKTKVPRWLRNVNWVIMNPDGGLIVRSPIPPDGRKPIFDRSDRDYFKGPKALAIEEGVDRVYFTKVYWSKDDEQYKFGAGEVLNDARGTNVGVLTLMLRSENLAEALGAPDTRTRTVIISEWDKSTVLDPKDQRPGTPARPEFVTLYHSAFGTSNKVEAVSHPILRELMPREEALPTQLPSSGVIQTRLVTFYRDPVARTHPELNGFWIAGFARVPGTHLIVVSLSRDRVLDALATAAFVASLAMLAMLFFFGWRFVRRRAHKHE